MAEADTPRTESDTAASERALSRLQHVYLLRVPLLTASGIVALCFFAFFTRTELLLGNAFDIESRWGIFFVSLTAFLSAWVVMVCWRLVRLYGAERFLNVASLQIPANLRRRDLIYYSPVALPIVIGVILKSTEVHWSLELIEAVLGLLVSLLCLAIVDGGQRWLARSDFARRPRDDTRNIDGIAGTSPALFFPAGIRPFDHLNNLLSTQDPTPSWFLNAVASLCRLVPQGIGRGYFDYDENTDEFRSILPGHLAASILLILTLAVYLLIGAADLALRIEHGKPPLIPTLSYAMLLAMLLCWALSGLAFFFDRYRIPVLIPLVAWLAFTSYFPGMKSDYYYPVIEPAQASGSPAATKASEDHSIIVVAANGGGIQAAAWAARVLTGLEEKCKDAGCDPDFAESIRLISAASGGSAGAMYFVNEYTKKGPPPDKELKKIVKRAEASSLDQIAWGLVYPDLRRTFFPNPFSRPRWDRGRAMEEAWLRKGDRSWEDKEGIQEGLSDWKQDTQAGWRPAVIFNTTDAESGERVPLATTDLPKGSHGRISYDGLFGEGEQTHDISVATAARLSAAFPYVSPAARADINGPAPHLVDGGYYDNYGISSLVEWLDWELENDRSIKRVLILEIRGAPSRPSYTYEGKQECPTRPRAEAPDRKSTEGWIYQAIAPASAVFHVRNTGQRTHNDVELELLKDKWQGDVTIIRALFEYDGGDTPLSWHLTKDDKKEIERNWDRELKKKYFYNTCAGWERVQTFLTKETAPDER